MDDKLSIVTMVLTWLDASKNKLQNACSQDQKPLKYTVTNTEIPLKIQSNNILYLLKVFNHGMTKAHVGYNVWLLCQDLVPYSNANISYLLSQKVWNIAR